MGGSLKRLIQGKSISITIYTADLGIGKLVENNPYRFVKYVLCSYIVCAEYVSIYYHSFGIIVSSY